MTYTVVRTLYEAEKMIAKREPFRLRDLQTLWATDTPPDSIGFLPPEYADSLTNAEYVVMSYRTPIAWEVDGYPYLPDVGYSPTTGVHQYTVKAAWDFPGRLWFPARGRDLRPAGGGPRRGGIDGRRTGE